PGDRPQLMLWTALTTRGSIGSYNEEESYGSGGYDWSGSREVGVPGARSRRGWRGHCPASDQARAAPAVLRQAAAVSRRHGSLRFVSSLGPAAVGARARGEADAGAVREALRQAGQERRG